MTRFWPPGEATRRPPAPRAAALYDPARAARIGRRIVRRRAKGMDAGAVAAALDEARFDARQASRHEDLVGDVSGHAELAEWERLDQLLAEAAPGTVYDPDTDDVLRAELAADAAAAAAREAELSEAQRSAARADELQALRELGTCSRPSPGTVTKPYATNSPGESAATSRPTPTTGSPAPWPRTSGTTATRPPARKPPVS
ncbi:hypothetical protein OG778_36410 (plasmid) [Streptomyces sp. NBC_00184]|uniref:hypothetical protein n=1 Tax=Streptomyces sp. NBC_00184 TaxID=2975673 RepID=UPI002E28D3D7|nr:hypothetical protein [Streptomyces sp. NBC_00184]